MKDCKYVWCKECQQEVVPKGPEHSCDGSLELKRLVEQKGWKYCPGKIVTIIFLIIIEMMSILACNTPCEKIFGCDDVRVSHRT